jgi:predicted permease
MWRELRLAVRSLARSPGFAIVTVLTMGLGIGANTAIFSVVWGVLYAPMPYEEAADVVQLQNRYLPSGSRGWVSAAELDAFRDVAGVFEGVVPITPENMNLTGLTTPMTLQGLRVGPGFFRLLGVEPLLGREFATDEGEPGAPAVAMLSEGLWTSAFDADPAVLGASVELDGRPRTVVGIVGSDYRPLSSYLFTGRDEAFWVPFVVDPSTFDARSVERHNLLPIGRLSPGVSAQEAETAMVQAVLRLTEAYPDLSNADGRDVAVVPLRDRSLAGAAGTLLLLTVAVVLVLAVACVNVANLLLARADVRTAEAAVRVALGADRGRLMWYGLSESIVIAAAGGLLGLALTALGRGVLTTLIPSSVAIPDGLAVGVPVLLFTFVVSLVAGGLAGLLPGMRLARGDVFGSIASGVGDASTGGRALLRRGMVVAQIAGAVVLVVGASLLVRSVSALRAVDPGFSVENRHLVSINGTRQGYASAAAVARLYTGVIERVEALPGVESAAVSWQTPQQTGMSDWPVYPERSGESEWYSADPNLVSPGFFETYGIELVAGRFFERADAELPVGPVILGRAAAERLWPGQTAVGRRVNLSFGEPVWREVVGVVENVRGRGLAQDPRVQTYMTFGEGPYAANPSLVLTIRGALGGDALRRGVQGILAELDPDLPVGEVRSLEAQVSSTIERERLLSTLLSLFGAVALALGAIGVYGMMSFAVRRRSREIGLRIALGAQPRGVVGVVVRQGIGLAAVGVAIGLAASAVTGRLLEGFLFGVSRSDPVTLALVATGVMAVALGATFLPARRAASVDPLTALRD